MSKFLNEHLLTNAPCGYALQKLVKDNDRDAYDSLFIETNQQFFNFTDCKKNNIENLKSSDFFPSILADDEYWQQIFVNLALKKAQSIINKIIRINKKPYSMNVYSPQIEYFLIVFQELPTQDNNEIELSNFFNINLDQLCIAVGMDDFLTKPIKKELIKIFEKYLEKEAYGQS